VPLRRAGTLFARVLTDLVRGAFAHSSARGTLTFRGREVILEPATVGILVIVALAAALGLVVVVAVLALRLRALRRAYASALDPSRREDLFQSVERQAGELQSLREDLGVVHTNTEHLRGLLRAAVSRVGVVRYDAFADMGGALSFSAALLDEHGDGLVVSAINGRSETRCYAKPITDGDSEYNLSDEETAAIGQAVSGDGRGNGATGGTRKGRRRAAS
jgi:hypothetical protein